MVYSFYSKEKKKDRAEYEKNIAEFHQLVIKVLEENKRIYSSDWWEYDLLDSFYYGEWVN